MKLLFVYNSFTLGGIETLILRLAKELKEDKHEVSVLFFSGKDNFNFDLLAELCEYASVYYWNDLITIPGYLKTKHPLLRLQFKITNKELLEKVIHEVNYIHAPDTYSLLFALKISRFNTKIPVSTGVYHINEYLINDFASHYFGRKILEALKLLGPKNILFFNEISREVYAKEIDPDFVNSIVAPIGVQLSDYEGVVLGRRNTRIVSIGRLTAWKTYNYFMIEVIYELKKLGYDFFYHSYGNGEKLNELNEIVQKYNLEKQVFFHPSVNYDLFKETISDSLLFIGAGTALIEASAAGVPALIGIENCDEAVTFGFLQDTSTYSYQERQLHYKKSRILDNILKLYEGTDEEYAKVCEESKNRAKDFDIHKTKELFLKMLEKNLVWHNNFKINNFLFFISIVKHFIVLKFFKNKKRIFFDRL